MSVAMALAEKLHHSAQRPEMARAGGGGGRELKYTAAFRRMPSPRRLVPSSLRWTPGRTMGRHQPPGGQHHCLRCCRRNRFSGAPQSRSLTPCPWSRLLHVFVPQKVEQLVDILAPLDFRVAEQVIEVPKIVVSTPCCSHSSPCDADGRPVGGSADDYLLFFVTMQRTMEQNVAIPVRLGRRGRNADLQGFLRGQGPTAQSSSLERISEQIAEQIAHIPVARGDPHGFRPGQSSSSVAHSPAAWLNTEDEPFQGGFSHFFPGRKKCD